jgi:hypothetical protein
MKLILSEVPFVTSNDLPPIEQFSDAIPLKSVHLIPRVTDDELTLELSTGVCNEISGPVLSFIVGSQVIINSKVSLL